MSGAKGGRYCWVSGCRDKRRVVEDHAKVFGYFPQIDYKLWEVVCFAYHLLAVCWAGYLNALPVSLSIKWNWQSYPTHRILWELKERRNIRVWQTQQIAAITIDAVHTASNVVWRSGLCGCLISACWMKEENQFSKFSQVVSLALDEPSKWVTYRKGCWGIYGSFFSLLFFFRSTCEHFLELYSNLPVNVFYKYTSVYFS